MKSLFFFSGVIILALLMPVFIKIGWLSYDPPVLFYNRSGLIKRQMRIWNDTLSATSATPVIDISAAGFSQIVDIQPQIIQNSASLANFAWCNVKTYTNTSVSLNLAQQNNNTVTILSISVLSGSPIAAPTGFSGTFISLRVTGY